MDIAQCKQNRYKRLGILNTPGLRKQKALPQNANVFAKENRAYSQANLNNETSKTCIQKRNKKACNQGSKLKMHKLTISHHTGCRRGCRCCRRRRGWRRRGCRCRCRCPLKLLVKMVKDGIDLVSSQISGLFARHGNWRQSL